MCRWTKGEENTKGEQTAQCLGSQFAGVAPLAIRALGSELPLVLIERIAHVRGGGGLALSAPCGGTLACRLGQALNGAHWAPAPPKWGGETRLSASLW